MSIRIGPAIVKSLARMRLGGAVKPKGENRGQNHSGNGDDSPFLTPVPGNAFILQSVAGICFALHGSVGSLHQRRFMAGVWNRADLQKLLGYFSAAPEEKDYSVLGTLVPQDAAGKCVYCNHCQPCPAGLDVGLINKKYYDLARAGDQLARRHYEKLEKRAGDCVKCGHCDRRCPFHVPQSHRMEKIQD